MHRKLMTPLLLATALLVFRSQAPAQSDAPYTAPASNCASQFFDPANYDWFTIENSCNQGIRVTLIARNGNQRGELDIPANQKRGNGESRSEYNAHGGYDLYICPALYTPVLPDGRTPVTSHANGFTCKYVGW